MKNRILTSEKIKEFKEYLIYEEKSKITVDEYIHDVALENGRYCKKHTCKIEGCYNEAWELSGTCSEHSHLR